MGNNKKFFLISVIFSVISFFSLIKPVFAHAATYYVDSVGGNNSNSGTSTESPWQTISKVNSTALSPGDQVLLKKGDSWREQLTMHYSGTSGNPISFGAYGSGANPLLIGADVETGFTLDSGSIYKKTGFTYNPRQVFQDNVRLITKSSKAAMVAGSFFWDSGTQTVYIWTTDSADPSTHTIEVSTRFRGIDFNGQSYITVDSIDTTKTIQTGYEWGITTGENNISVSNAVSSWNGQRGFRIGSTTYGVLVGDNNVISDSVAHDNISEGFWIGGGTNNGCIRCEVYNGGKDNTSKGYNTGDIGGILVGADAVNNFVKDSYIHDVYKGYVLMVEHENHADVTKPTGTIISGNVIVNNVADLSTTVEEEGENSVYSNNVIYTSGSGSGDLIAMQTQGGTATGSVSPKFYNNTLYMGSTNYGNLVDLMNVSDPVFKNNILYEPAGTDGNIISVGADGDTNYNGLSDSVTGTITSDYNDFFNDRNDYNYYYKGGYYLNLSEWQTVTSLDSHSLSVDPLFTDTATHDFTLQAGSPVIDHGTDVGLTTDRNGNTIPQGSAPDMGAYEFGVSPTPTPTSTPTPTVTPTPVSGHGSSSTDNKPTSCTTLPPENAPDLFAVSPQGSTSVILYFAPVSGSHSGYTVAYGTGSGADQFAVSFDNNETSGAVAYTIHELFPATWYFKVRGNNGCMPGGWSQTVSLKLGQVSSGSSYTVSSSEPSYSVSAITPGTKIQCQNYTIKSGDTLWDIAGRFLQNNFLYTTLLKKNKLISSLIHPGQKIKVGC